MGQMDTHAMLRRLLKAAQPQDAPDTMTVGRALRLAAARAAERALGLSLTVLGVTQESEDLEAACKRLEGDWLLIGLWRQGELAGVAALDLQTRAAAIEMQTLGQLRSAPAPERAITASDIALNVPFIEALLAQIEDAADGTELLGWTEGATPGPRLADARAVGLALAEASYRVVTMTLDLGTGERQGEVMLILPAAPAPVHQQDGEARAADRFAAQFRATVMEAPAELHAVLHRMKLPFSRISALEVGQTLPLPGVTVASVRMEGPGGQVFGRARLGQVTGLRAVRLEVAPAARMSEVQLPERAGQPGEARPRPLGPPGQPGAL